MTEILVIGSGSLTGSRFVDLGKQNFEMYGAGGSMDLSTPHLMNFWDLDITNEEKVKEVIDKFPGKFIINFAGATLVDEIEKTKPSDPTDEKQLNQNIAYQVNVLGTKFLANACKKSGKLIIE